MQNIDGKGYMPVADYLPTLLSEMTMFHDAKSLEGRLEFNSVNQALRYPFQVDIEELNDTRPIDGTINGTPYTQIKRPSLVTPRSLYGKVTKYSILEYNPLLDSSNMTMEDWIKIAVDIGNKTHMRNTAELNYELFDSFVVLHGTDTMCYTSSALSFMLEDLGKTVIVCPLFPIRRLDYRLSNPHGRGPKRRCRKSTWRFNDRRVPKFLSNSQGILSSLKLVYSSRIIFIVETEPSK
jgi:lysophospholipase